MATLEHEQFELDGYVFGRLCPVNVESVEWGSPEIRQVDSNRPREDGRRFGRDQRGGRTLSFSLFTMGTDINAMTDLDELAARWDAAAIRAESGAVSVLRWNIGGRSRKVWGRPRQISADPHYFFQGKVMITADFETVDHLFYADGVQSTSVSIAPPPVGGMTAPLTDPLIGTQAGQVQGRVFVTGSTPAWLTTRIYGPILRPEISVGGSWSATLNVDLRNDEYIDISPIPWDRKVRKNGKENASGTLTSDSQRLSQMLITPGQHEVVLRGTDPTGKASAVFSWLSAYHSP